MPNARIFDPGSKRNIKGRTFGELTAVEWVGQLPGGSDQWRWSCACGGSVVATARAVVHGTKRTCGHDGAKVGGLRTGAKVAPRNKPKPPGMISESMKTPRLWRAPDRAINAAFRGGFFGQNLRLKPSPGGRVSRPSSEPGDRSSSLGEF